MPRKKPDEGVQGVEVSPKVYHSLFQASGEGQRVLVELQNRFELRSSHVPGDPYTTAFNEGQRSVMLFIYNKIAEGVQ